MFQRTNASEKFCTSHLHNMLLQDGAMRSQGHEILFISPMQQGSLHYHKSAIALSTKEGEGAGEIQVFHLMLSPSW